MKNSPMTYARNAGFAALLAFAANASAQYYPPTIYLCPSGTNTNITCGGCTVNLTCDLNGGGITILANGVKLNGNGHLVTFSPGDAVKVLGVGAAISNMDIRRPQGSGIHFAYTGTNQDWGTLDNVSVSWPGLDGVSRAGAGHTSVTVRNSFFDMGRYGIYNSDEQAGARTVDVFNSELAEASSGFVSLNAATQHHDGNQYVYNSNVGAADFSNTNAGYYSNSFFYDNMNVGLEVSNNGTNTITLSGNTGYGNPWDCWANSGTALVATNNTWTTNNGCVSTR